MKKGWAAFVIEESYVCPIPPNPDIELRKPCDGSANSYFRHRQRGEEPCRRSKQALAFAKRRSRRTGLWVGNVPFVESEDDMYRRLLTPEEFDLWEARVNMKTYARRPERFRHEEFYADPHTPE